MRRILLLSLASLLAAPAMAADAPPAAAPAAEPPICTTVTTVVKRGDLVLSTNSTTRCEDDAHGGAFHAAEALEAPRAVLEAPVAVLGAISLGGGDLLKLKNSAGYWRAVDERTGDICHLDLSVRTTTAGFLARGHDCRGDLGKAAAWTFRDGAAEILTDDGQLIVRLTGTRDQVKGQMPDGDRLTLER